MPTRSNPPTGSALGSGLPAQVTAQTADTPTKRGRGRPRDPRTDAKITEAAASLIIERGFDGMTVDDVAERAGVGKATVYRRWPSKSDLAFASIATHIRDEFPEPDTGSITTDLRQIIRASVSFASSPAGNALAKMCVAEAARDARVAQLVKETQDQRLAWLRTAIARATERGEVRSDIDPDITYKWFMGYLLAVLVTDEPLPDDRQSEEIVQFILHGIAA